MKLCAELLYQNGRVVAVCCSPWGVEHSHQDQPPADMVRAGTARPLNMDTLKDFISSHGCGPATKYGVRVAVRLVAGGDDYATAGAEVAARGLTAE